VQRNRERRVAIAAVGPAIFTAGDAVAAEGGLVLLPDPTLLIVLTLFFAALVPFVNGLVLRPMLRVLDARAERTDGARRRAARLEEQVRDAVARYERSIQEVRRAAEGTRQEILDDARRRATEETLAARSHAETELGRVRRELESAVRGARDGLANQARELAREAAGRVLGRVIE
jgi:F0F1-type ATP synthase membrane subunit b/b'